MECSMTPLEIEAAARDRYNAIGDPFYPTSMIMNLIYQASMQLALEAFVIERKYTTTSTSGTREYPYPTNAFAIRRVEYDGKKIFPTTLESDTKTSTTETTGTPGRYAIWNEELVLFPTPDTTSDVIAVYTYNRPQEVTTASTLEVPAEYHLDMIDFILSIMYGKDQNLQLSKYYREVWERNIQRIKRHEMKKKVGDEFAVVQEEPFGEAIYI
jgi:hypothetical protein